MGSKNAEKEDEEGEEWTSGNVEEVLALGVRRRALSSRCLDVLGSSALGPLLRPDLESGKAEEAETAAGVTARVTYMCELHNKLTTAWGGAAGGGVEPPTTHLYNCLLSSLCCIGAVVPAFRVLSVMEQVRTDACTHIHTHTHTHTHTHRLGEWTPPATPCAPWVSSFAT